MFWRKVSSLHLVKAEKRVLKTWKSGGVLERCNWCRRSSRSDRVRKPCFTRRIMHGQMRVVSASASGTSVPPSNDQSGAPSATQMEISDSDVDKLLALDDDDDDEEEEEKEDGERKRKIILLRKKEDRDVAATKEKNRELKHRAKKKSKRKSSPWKVGDIVWKLYKQRVGCEKRPRVVKDDDLFRSREEYEARKEELWGGLFVIKTACSNTLTKKVAELLPVFDGLQPQRRPLSQVKVDRSDFSFVHLYRLDYSVNQTIMEAIFKSIAGNLNRADYQSFKTGLMQQHEAVKDFIKLRSEFKEIEPHKYLVMDDIDRDQYMRKWRPNGLWGDLMALEPEKSPEMSENDSEGEESLIIPALCEEPPKPTIDNSPLGFSAPPEMNAKLIQWFKKEDVHAHLRSVMLGQISSERHHLLTTVLGLDLSLTSRMSRLSNSAFIHDDGCVTELELFDIVQKSVFNDHQNRLKLPKGCKEVTRSYMQNYINHCLIPEGIIYYLMKTMDLNASEAEKIFVSPSKSVAPDLDTL